MQLNIEEELFAVRKTGFSFPKKLLIFILESIFNLKLYRKFHHSYDYCKSTEEEILFTVTICWKMYLSLIFFCFTAALSHGIPQVERNAGGCVILPCKYNQSAVEGAEGSIDIEWTVSNVANPLIWLSGGKVFKKVPRLSPRISFMAHNSTSGDASVWIVSLTAEDSGVYRCKVRKGGYSNQINVNVTVLDKDMFDPAVITENITEIQRNVGESVILPCGYNKSAAEGAEGNVVIEWSVRNQANLTKICQSTVYERNPGMSPRISLVSDSNMTGNASVSIVSLTTADSGLYRCTVWKGWHILHQNSVIVTVLGGEAPAAALLSVYISITLVVCIVLITLLLLGYCHFRTVRNNSASSLNYKENELYETVQRHK
ncbi:coxsackievirus and adenovirus receptor-like isoform X2 [Polyodon spathula]|uniref:coxsackievirus and adenovirus receptor-like isoform X2 n=1 Tax=Polyodon spathula TaxID=7913 RepID=UPI001B7F107E|nr:coxsackievirus and adenovirus receptor-like isoform X2 [Polyodon spathula]